jgi:hypothetical protein
MLTHHVPGVIPTGQGGIVYLPVKARFLPLIGKTKRGMF